MSEAFIQAVKDGHNCCLTGGGGVGKTYTINQMREQIKKPVIMTATTGLAALHVRGQTVHSLTGIGTHQCPSAINILMKKNWFREKCHELQGIEILVIDEISMLRRDQFDLINNVFKFAKGSPEFFGGTQVIVVGDFLQLPPIVKRGEPQPNQWIFQSSSWEEAQFKVFHLTEVKRQDDETFVNALNEIRFGSVGLNVENMFRSRMDIENDAPIKLMSRNADVDEWNELCLRQVEGDEVKLPGLYTFHESLQPSGNPEKDEDLRTQRRNLYFQMKNSINVPEELRLRAGCRVLICKNDSEQGYVNGSMGTFIKHGRFINTLTEKYAEITDLLDYAGVPYEREDEWGRMISVGEASESQISFLSAQLKWGDYNPSEQLKIELDGGRMVYVGKNDYGIASTRFFDEDGAPMDEITFHQFPIRLGYAITIHKSQGMTLEQVEVNFQGSFACGAVYVALSRAKSLDGLFIKNWSGRFVKADSAAIQFYLNLNKQQGA